VLATPALKQVFERFADSTFVVAARHAPDVGEFFEALVDPKLAHGDLSDATSASSLRRTF
jgi:hypothetical protein